MTAPRIVDAPSDRRIAGARLAIALAVALGLLVVAPAARADVAPAFAGRVAVNTQYVTGAGQATDVAFAGDGRALVTTKTGTVVVRRADGTLGTIAYPFGGTLDTDSEKGLLGVVADPNVAQNRAFYFYVSNGPIDDKHRVYRAVLGSGDTLAVDAVPIIAAARGAGPGLEGPANHDGGSLFIYGGQLYVGVGDTGVNATPPVNKYGSCLNKGSGKVLRVNLDGSVPADNPLVGATAVTGCATNTGPWAAGASDPRIFAWGLRNPWRFWIDARTGLLWIGDVGEDTQEEISVGRGNQHYGYPFVEGAQVWGNVDGLNCATETPGRACSPPAFSYTHADGQAVTGGLIVEGCGWTKVFGATTYLFGDSSAGWIRALPVNAARTGFSATAPIDFATYGAAMPVSFRMGPDQALYVVMYGAGAVYRFAPADRSGADCAAAPAVPSGSPALTWLLAALTALAGVRLLRRPARP